MKWGLHIVLALILASLYPTVAPADIFQWTDNAGVTHYTNLKAEVPEEQGAQVVVDERVWPPQAPVVPAVTSDAKEDPVVKLPPHEAEADMWRAYAAGLESGLADRVGTGGGGVYINGPLAVTTVSTPAPYSSYAVPAYDWLLPGSYGVVTTSVIGRHAGPIHHRIGTGFRPRSPFFQPFTNAAGPPPIGAAGRPPIGAAGRPPLGAAGGSPMRLSGGHRW